MKRIFMFVGLLALAISALAEPAHQLDLICCSYHFDRNKDYNETNLGLEYSYRFDTELDTSINVGVYKNSEYTTSTYIGAERAFPINENVDLTFMLGVVTGYKQVPILPAFIPGILLYETVHFRITHKVIGASVTVLRW